MCFSRVAGWLITSLAMSLIAAAPNVRLVDAVKNTDKASVRALLEQHVDVNAPDTDGATALHWAAYWDDLETADLLIRRGANVKAENRTMSRLFRWPAPTGTQASSSCC
jgi:ankyrin repeat protein